MEFEQCEIRVNRYDRGWLGPHWEFIAMARGPDGTYTVARTPKFPGYVPRWYYYIPGIKPDISYVELLENELSRGFLDALIDHLTHIGWELLAESGSGGPWYRRTFRRRISPQKKSSRPLEKPSSNVDLLRQEIAQLQKENDEYWGDYVNLDTPGYAAFVRKRGDAYLALAQALTNSSDPEQLQEGHNTCYEAEKFYKLLGLADEQAKAICQKGYITEQYEVVTHRDSQGPATFFQSAVWTATPAMKPHYERELAEFKRRWQARLGK